MERPKVLHSNVNRAWARRGPRSPEAEGSSRSKVQEEQEGDANRAPGAASHGVDQDWYPERECRGYEDKTNERFIRWWASYDAYCSITHSSWLNALVTKRLMA